MGATHRFALALPFIALVAVPLHVAASNDISLRGIPLGSWTGLVAVAAVVGCALIALVVSCRHTPLASFANLVTRFAFFFVTLTGFVLPLAHNTSMADLSTSRTNTTNLAIALALGLGLSVLHETRFGTAVTFGLATFVVFNLATSAIQVVANSRLNSGSTGLEISPSHNIFVLSFDGLSGPAIEAVVREHPEHAEFLDGFVIYNQLAASSPATSASVC